MCPAVVLDSMEVRVSGAALGFGVAFGTASGLGSLDAGGIGLVERPRTIGTVERPCVPEELADERVGTANTLIVGNISESLAKCAPCP